MTDTQQDVFRYFDGAAWVYGDFHDMKRRLWFDAGDPADLAGKVNAVAKKLNEATTNEVKEATEARCALIAAVRTAFQMAPFDRATGQGATDLHCLATYCAFCAFDAAREQAATSAAAP